MQIYGITVLGAPYPPIVFRAVHTATSIRELATQRMIMTWQLPLDIAMWLRLKSWRRLRPILKATTESRPFTRNKGWQP